MTRSAKAAPPPVRKAARHSRGTGRCDACGGPLSQCPQCKGQTLHRIDGDYRCEKGGECSPSARLASTWREEMHAAVAKVK